MSRQKRQLTAKIAIIGDVAVGKSSITIRFIYDKFDLKVQSTLGAAYMEKICTFQASNIMEQPQRTYKVVKKSLMSDKSEMNPSQSNQNSLSSVHQIKLQIWDTAGQEKYKSIAKLYYRDCRVAVLTYDCTRRQTFQNLKSWHQQIQKHAPKNIILYLVSNKIDLIQLMMDKQPVPYSEGQSYAKSIGALFFEVSAKNRKGVKQLFNSICNCIGPIIFNERISNRSSPRNVLKSSILENDKDGDRKKKCCNS